MSIHNHENKKTFTKKNQFAAHQIINLEITLFTAFSLFRGSKTLYNIISEQEAKKPIHRAKF
jgi:hypothetical protein